MPFRRKSPVPPPPADPNQALMVVPLGAQPDTAPALPSSAPPPRQHHVVDHSGPNWDEHGDYIVGKGRPPEATRWQKGQSGNPRGPKPKEKSDPTAAFYDEVMADFTARVNGEEVTLNLGSFALQLIKAGAAKGTVKSQQLLLDLFLTAVRHRVERDATPEMEAWEQKLVDTVLESYNLPASPVVRKARDSTVNPGAET